MTNHDPVEGHLLALARHVPPTAARQAGLSPAQMVAAGLGIGVTGEAYVQALLGLDESLVNDAIAQQPPDQWESTALLERDDRAVTRRAVLLRGRVPIELRLTVRARARQQGDPNIEALALAGADEDQLVGLLEESTDRSIRQVAVTVLSTSADPAALQALATYAATLERIDDDAAHLASRSPQIAAALPDALADELTRRSLGYLVSHLPLDHPALPEAWQRLVDAAGDQPGFLPHPGQADRALAAGIHLPRELLLTLQRAWGTHEIFEATPLTGRVIRALPAETYAEHLVLDTSGLQALLEHPAPTMLLCSTFRLDVPDTDEAHLLVLQVAHQIKTPRGFVFRDSPAMREALAHPDTATSLAGHLSPGLLAAVHPYPVRGLKVKQIQDIADDLLERVAGHGAPLDAGALANVLMTLRNLGEITIEQHAQFLLAARDRGELQHLPAGPASAMLQEVCQSSAGDERHQLLRRLAPIIAPTGQEGLAYAQRLTPEDVDTLLDHLPATALRMDDRPDAPRAGLAYRAVVARLQREAEATGRELGPAMQTLASLLPDWQGPLGAACQTAALLLAPPRNAAADPDAGVDDAAADCTGCGQGANRCNTTSWNYDEEGLCCAACSHPWAVERGVALLQAMTAS